ncbi:hypothetical protein [Geobacillus kaustophilus]|uniref:hypothetical protein n=1 Tax=Geobacillus kaustophilus TaxID=1462 RepID=UPI0005CCE23B|nr:hypothetical protein [Geobacillus kaustophilus]
MNKEKMEWLKQIGAEELNPPYEHNGKEFKYRVPMDDKDYMYYSESYLNETPLDELKSKFKRWCSVWQTSRSIV